MKIKKEKKINIFTAGFTLIEMLVTVAIIGVLATVVLTELKPVKDKAKDTRIIQEINQIRSLAESLYNGNYDNLEELPKANIEYRDLEILVNDINSQGGNVHINKSSDGNRYAVYTILNQKKGKEPNLIDQYYCVDSEGYAIISYKKPEFPRKYICPEEGEKMEIKL
jgi:prepilin-type N-terminal cleavage/methylation domain-containing protein